MARSTGNKQWARLDLTKYQYVIIKLSNKRGNTMVTKQDVEEFISDDSEWKEIIRDLINNDYTVEALKQDYKEWRENNE